MGHVAVVGAVEAAAVVPCTSFSRVDGVDPLHANRPVARHMPNSNLWGSRRPPAGHRDGVTTNARAGLTSR